MRVKGTHHINLTIRLLSKVLYKTKTKWVSACDCVHDGVYLGEYASRLIVVLFNVLWRAGEGKDRTRAKCAHAPCVYNQRHIVREKYKHWKKTYPLASSLFYVPKISHSLHLFTHTGCTDRVITDKVPGLTKDSDSPTALWSTYKLELNFSDIGCFL